MSTASQNKPLGRLWWMSIIGVVAVSIVEAIAPAIGIPIALSQTIVAAITAITVSHNAARSYEDAAYNKSNGVPNAPRSNTASEIRP